MTSKKGIKFISKCIFILIISNIFIINQIVIHYKNKNDSLDMCYIAPEFTNLKIIHFPRNIKKLINKPMINSNFIFY